jgi:hypothetical protein
VNRSLTTAITLAVATVILFSGLAYAVVRPINYRSEATLVLAPTPEKSSDLAGVLDSFQRSGTAVTYVELLASQDVLKSAGDPPVSVKVRTVPDSRVIRISTEAGDKNIVQPALRAILTAASQQQQKLVDVWELKVLQAPAGPTQASTGTSLILLATLLLAFLGALTTWTLLRRYGAPPDRRTREAARAEAMATTGWLTSEGPRYPTNR